MATTVTRQPDSNAARTLDIAILAIALVALIASKIMQSVGLGNLMPPLSMGPSFAHALVHIPVLPGHRSPRELSCPRISRSLESVSGFGFTTKPAQRIGQCSDVGSF